MKITMTMDELLYEFNMTVTDRGPEYGKYSGGYPLEQIAPGKKVWTRTDGTKWREPGSVEVCLTYKTIDNGQKKIDKLVSKFFKWVLKNKKYKKIDSISPWTGWKNKGESEKWTTIKYKGIFIGCVDENIQWGSLSRISNPSSVWE